MTLTTSWKMASTFHKLGKMTFTTFSEKDIHVSLSENVTFSRGLAENLMIFFHKNVASILNFASFTVFRSKQKIFCQ
jgi:hypothetical protein